MEAGSRLYPSYPHLLFAVFASAPDNTDPVVTDYQKYKFFFRPYYNVTNAYADDRKLYIPIFKMGGNKKLALIIEDAKWTELYRKGSKIRPPMKDFYEKNGMDVVYYEVIDIKEKMFFPLFEKIAASKADVIYFVTSSADSIAISKQWAQSSAKDIDMMIQGAAASFASFYKMTGGRALGVVSQQVEIPVPYTKDTLALVNRLKEKGVNIALGGGPGTYDSPWILKKIVEMVGNVKDVDKMIKTLEKTEVTHKFWTWAFNNRHDAKFGYPPYMPYVLGQFQKDGKFVAIFPPEVVKLVNPNGKFIKVKDLRKMAGE
jgi:ABC-type branched-subunit amino acid transport system substrate-binding protein